MPQVYKFQVSMPVTSTLPRDRISNTLHFQHASGGLLDTDLTTMCTDLANLYKDRYGISNKEITAKAYNIGAPPQYPRASVTINPGGIWDTASPREIALCLSYAGANRGNKSERGRIYLMPGVASASGLVGTQRPSSTNLAWALAFYTTANGSFPDLGGVDWKFGIYSPTYDKFTQSKQAWVNDEWDTQRRRGLRETMRSSVTRDG